MIEVPTKSCAGCHQIKPVTEFYRDVRNRTGYRSRCKLCHIRYVRGYADRVQNRLYQQRYYHTHKAYYAAWRRDNRESYNAKRRLAYRRRREQISDNPATL